MTAAALLREAAQAGVTVRLAEGKPKVAGNPPPELLARLREHKAEIVEILSADRCRHCGEPLAWPGPAGIVLGDGTAECQRCADAEVWRLFKSRPPRCRKPRCSGRPGRGDAQGRDP